MSDLQINLSANELKILAAAWMSFPAPPKPDYELIAKMCGYKNAGVAAVSYGQVKRKLLAASPIDANGDTPKKAAKAKRAAPDAFGDEKPKKRGRKPKAVKEESTAAGDDALTNADGVEEEEAAEEHIKSEQQDDHSDEN